MCGHVPSGPHRTVLGDINPKDSEDMTPLHCAAQFGRVRNVLLLSEGIPRHKQIMINFLYKNKC